MNLYQNVTSYLQDKPDFLSYAVWGIVVMVILVLLALVYIFVFRLGFLISSFRRRRVEAEWNDVFRYLRTGEEPESYPPISRGEKPIFLEYWLENRELANERFGVMLDELARRTRLDKTIVQILDPGKFEVMPSKVWLQGIAIAAIEFVDTEDTREALLEMTKSENLFLVVQACTVSAKLRVKGYEKEIIQTMFRFPSDAPEIFARVSQAGGSDVLHFLQPFLDRMPHHTVMNFISLAEESHDDSLVPILLHRLQRTQQQEEIAAIIRTLGQFEFPGLRNAIVPYLEHPNLYVRIQAARAMGQVGQPDDIEKLKPLLSSSEWWLRYRTAQAICRLSKNEWQKLEALRASLKDAYAKDIIQHAYEEMDWCST